MNQELLIDSLPKPQKPNLLNVSNNSKKIPTKAKNKTLASKAPKTTSNSQKKYQTTKKKAKLELIDEIRRMVDPDFTDENWCKTVLNFKPEEYKIFLKKLYPDIETIKIPARWKKIKRTLNNKEKSDGRGGALFGNVEEKEEFKRHIEYVIRNKMKTKCFEELRKNVVPKIQEMFKRNERKFSNQVFQKHFWSYFLNNPENDCLKKAWKLLRRTKPRQGGAGNESFVSENLDISLLNDGDESLILEKDLEILEEEVDLKEEANKDSKNNEIAIEICPLEDSEENNDIEEKSKANDDMVEIQSVGGFFEGDCLVENIENGKDVEEEGIFEVRYVNFDDEFDEYFGKEEN